MVTFNKVVELRQNSDLTWNVITEKGTIKAEHVVNAAGLWAKQVGKMVGLDLPVSPLKHHYLVTETIPKLEKIDVPSLAIFISLTETIIPRERNSALYAIS